jgi:glutamate carboxypeptidase
MKGGIVIGLTALEALHECDVDFNWTVLLNSDEETGSFHSHDAIFAASKEHDVGIALEPAMPDGSLVVQRLGSGQFQIEVHGKAAHAGRDFAKGVSAVNALGEILVTVAKWSDPSNGMIVNVGPLLGGQTTNIVPDYAACWGNMRFADDRQACGLQNRLKALQTTGGALPRIVVNQIINRPPKPLIPPVQKLAEAAKSIAHDLEIPLNLGASGGVSDGNIMQAAGLPTIDTFGARGGNLHRTDEFIELESLVERGKLLAVLLARIVRGAIQLA